MQDQDVAKPKDKDPYSMLAWVLGVVTLIVIAILWCFENRELFRSKKSRWETAQSDMRTLQIAIESYYVDCNSYPAWAAGPGGINSRLGLTNPAYYVPTFAIKTALAPNMFILTTPISYMVQFPPDPFTGKSKATYAYWTDPQSKGWIVYSTGPDGKYEINPAEDYTPGNRPVSDSLILKTWDPTNGADSAGDIWKVKD